MKVSVGVFVAFVGLAVANPTVPPNKLMDRQVCECYCGDGELYEPTYEDCVFYGGCDGCCAYIVRVP